MLPDWMNALLADTATPTGGWQAREAMRVRELAMPPDIRMSGRKRELRDAILGRMLLRQMSAETRQDGWQTLKLLAARENKLAELTGNINELGAELTDEDREHCHEAARMLHAWVMTEKNRNGR